MKYLFLFVFFGVIWWLWKKRSEPQSPGVSERPDPVPEKMVVCAHCGVHMPESDALSDGERNYCCAAHRDAGSSNKCE